MLKIGEFSRLSKVTVKTLRYYDEIGLLTPTQVDQSTGHRYYRVDQLPCIHRIMALKELGLSLEQIALMIHDNLDSQQIRGMLLLKQAEIQQHLREEQARLAQVEFRLRMLEAEVNVPALEIVVKRIEPFRALTFRRTYANAQEAQRIGDQLKPLYLQASVPETGPSIAILYGEEFTLTDLELEIVGPVHDTWTEDVPVGQYGKFTVRKVAAIETSAVHMHEGSVEQLPEKLVLVQRWAVSNGYRLCDEMRLVQHRGELHYQDEANLIEIQHKIEPA